MPVTEAPSTVLFSTRPPALFQPIRPPSITPPVTLTLDNVTSRIVPVDAPNMPARLIPAAVVTVRLETVLPRPAKVPAKPAVLFATVLVPSVPSGVQFETDDASTLPASA